MNPILPIQLMQTTHYNNQFQQWRKESNLKDLLAAQMSGKEITAS